MNQFIIDKDNKNVFTVIKNCVTFIQNLPKGKWQVVVKQYKYKRSSSQNSYLWGVVYKTIADNDAGFFINEETESLIIGTKLKHADLIHEYFKQNLLAIGKIGETVLTKSTAELNTSDFTDYVEKIMQIASSQLGIYIPTPSEQGLTDYQKWWSGK